MIKSKQPEIDVEKKIFLLADEIRSFLNQAENFFQHVQQQHLFRKVLLHKQKVSIKGLESEFKDIYIPNFYWIEYIGDKRKYLSWKEVSHTLNRVNATLDERLLHIRIHYEFQRLHLEAKSYINHLKDMALLSNELKELLEDQGVTLKMLHVFKSN